MKITASVFRHFCFFALICLWPLLGQAQSVTTFTVNGSATPAPVAFTSSLAVPLRAEANVNAPITFNITGGTGVAAINSITWNNARTTTATLRVTGAGTFTLSADAGGGAVVRTFTVTRGTQAITFPQPTTPQTFTPGLSVPLAAVASSGLSVVYDITAGAGTVAMINGSQVDILGAGSFTVRAQQSGNANWQSAPPVSRIVTVNRGGQVITFPPLATPSVLAPDGSLALPATSSSGLPVTFTIVSGSQYATVSGSRLIYTGLGPVRIRADQAGNTNWLAATSVEQNVSVRPGVPANYYAWTAEQEFTVPGVYNVTIPSGATFVAIHAAGGGGGSLPALVDMLSYFNPAPPTPIPAGAGIGGRGGRFFGVVSVNGATSLRVSVGGAGGMGSVNGGARTAIGPGGGGASSVTLEGVGIGAFVAGGGGASAPAPNRFAASGPYGFNAWPNSGSDAGWGGNASAVTSSGNANNGGFNGGGSGGSGGNNTGGGGGGGGLGGARGGGFWGSRDDITGGGGTGGRGFYSPLFSNIFLGVEDNGGRPGVASGDGYVAITFLRHTSQPPPLTNAITWSSHGLPAQAYVGDVLDFASIVTNSGTKNWGIGHFANLSLTGGTPVPAPADLGTKGVVPLAGIPAGSGASLGWASLTLPSVPGTYTYTFSANESGTAFPATTTATILVRARPYTVAVTDLGDGVTSGGGSYVAGDLVTLTPRPGTSAYFSGFSGDVSGPGATNSDPAPALSFTLDPAVVDPDGDRIIAVTASYTGKLSQVVSVTPPGFKLANYPPFNLAWVNSTLPTHAPTSGSIDSGPATINVTEVTLNGTPGTVRATLNWPGTTFYLPASASVDFSVGASGTGTILDVVQPDTVVTTAANVVSAATRARQPDASARMSAPPPASFFAVDNSAQAKARIQATRDLIAGVGDGIGPGTGTGTGPGGGTSGGGNNPPAVTSLPSSPAPGQQVTYQGFVWTWTYDNVTDTLLWVEGRAAQ